MEEAGQTDKIQHKSLSSAARRDKNNDKINSIIERKEVLNKVLRKMIDKINHPEKSERIGEQ